MTTLNKNLALLKSLHPKTYEVLKHAQPSKEYEISISLAGCPTLSHIDAKGSKKYLLSKYDPMREAYRLIQLLDIGDISNFIVVGIGLGYHITELIKLAPAHSKIIVIETDPHLAKLAFATNDLKDLLIQPGLTFVLPNEPTDVLPGLEKEKVNFSLNGYRLVQQNALSEVKAERTNKLLAAIKDFYQASTIELKTQSVRSKTFYHNIYKNYSNWLSSSGVNTLKNSLPNIPAIICSAGPSLDKNIQNLKVKRDNYLLISVATALKPLLANKITPDFIVTIDPEDITVNFFDMQNTFRKSWLLYDPVIPEMIPELFSGKHLAYNSSINLAHWLQKHIGEKGSLGKVFSVAHAASQFASLMGCSPIIFLGQDLSFEKYRMHSKHSYYYSQRETTINQLSTMKIFDQLKYNLYSENLVDRKDIFGNDITTTISMDTYSNIFANSIEEGSNCLNATEGGIGIAGLINISLSEAINTHCTTNISPQVSDALDSIQPIQPEAAPAARAADKQLTFFTQLVDRLNEIEDKFLKNKSVLRPEMEGFVESMKLTIKHLLKNEEATLLLQGYDYSGFSIWNQRSTSMLNRKESSEQKELLQEEFLRDRDFFEVLKESVQFNMLAFERFASRK